MSVKITWERFHQDVRNLAKGLSKTLPLLHYHVWGVPTGGSFVAQKLCAVDPGFFIQQVDSPVLPNNDDVGLLIVDDLIDSGRTILAAQNQALEQYEGDDMHRFAFATVYSKPHSPEHCRSAVTLAGWLHFPWEKEGGDPVDAVTRLLEYIGEDPNRNGLKDTPARVVKALKEMTCGYKQDPKEILSRVFEESYDEVVVLRGIPFTSLCEHHMLVFSGTVDIGYLPSEGRVVGLSKLARVVDCFANRLQVQERLTREIAETIGYTLMAKGVGVIVRASHSCMACRGVRKPGSEMVTSMMLGVFRDKPEARLELLNLFSGS